MGGLKRHDVSECSRETQVIKNSFADGRFATQAKQVQVQLQTWSWTEDAVLGPEAVNLLANIIIASASSH